MMNNAEIVKGIDLVIEGLETIKKGFVIEVENTIVPIPVKVEKPKVEENTVEETVGNYSAEQLNSMKYNEFKKLASSLGVKCTGTREEIMTRILALNNEAFVEEVEEAPIVEEVAEEVAEETKSDNAPRGKKLSKKEAVEPTTDEFDRQAEEIAKETPVEEIIEALAEVDIKATKKNAVSKLAEALREGLIELEADEEEEEEDVFSTENTVEETEDGEEISADSYFAEYDPNGYNNPENMTEERLEAVEAKMDEILTAYSEEELSDDEIASYVEDNATEAEIELLGEEYTSEDILKLYMELIKRTIDNDGEEHEQGEPYEVADKDVCCGHELKYVRKTKKYICEHCGTEYEAE